jgi:segregation and condensation protein A
MNELSAYTVKSGAYEGPFELLLDLIEKRKLLVNEVSLASVTDDFVAFAREAVEFPTALAADFISIAATLLLIKSRSLLPELELTNEEEVDVDDLAKRLAVLEKIRNAARRLAALSAREGHALQCAGERTPDIFFAPGPALTTPRLTETLRRILTEEQEILQKLPEVRIRPLVSIEEMMDTLRARVERAVNVSFKDFTGNTKEKVEVIVSFLALLELVKQGSIEAVQPGRYGDITISSAEVVMPRY